MIIKKITLENIRSYRNQTIEIPQGSVLLSGDIGCGKSTILLAIEFALFGIRRDFNATGLLRNGEKKGSVELHFTLDNKEVMIKRTLRRGTDSVAQEAGYIMINGAKTDATPVELKSMVLDLLQYPKESLTKTKSLIWRYTVYTPQEEMKHILFEAKDARVDTLRQIFGIDKYKRIAANAYIYTKSLREERKLLEVQLLDEDEKRKEMQAHIETRQALITEHDRIFPTLQEHKLKIEQKRHEIKTTEENIKLINEIKTKHDVYSAKITEKTLQKERLSLQLQALENQIHTAEEEAKKASSEMDLQADPAEMMRIEEEILKAEESLRLMQSQKQSTKERLESTERRIAELNAELSRKKDRISTKEEKERIKDALVAQIKDKRALEEEILTLEQKNIELSNRMREYQVHKRRAEETKSAIANLEQCPTCKQTVGQEHKHTINTEANEQIEQLTIALKELTDEQTTNATTLARQKQMLNTVVQAQQNLAVLTAELIQLNSITEDAARLENQVTSLNTEKQEILTIAKELDTIDLEEEKARITTKRETLKKLQEIRLKIAQREQTLKTLEEKKQQKTAITEQISNIMIETSELEMLKTNCAAQIDAHKHLPAAAERLHAALDAIQAEERAASVRIAEIIQRAEAAAENIHRLQTDILKKEAVKKEVQKISLQHQWLEEMFIKMMGTMEQHVMLKIHEQFNDLFTNWFSELIEDENISTRLDNEFSPVMMQNGYETDVEHMSGGEKTAVALAYRLALNKVINDVVSEVKTKDLMILDEPTDGFSSEQLDKLKDVLEVLGIKQVIIVSHESKIESMVDHVIRIGKREGVSGVLTS
jgi:exonuclease SbcC